ncbi:MAG: DHA2 family efflux MFS transporter permease subunit [Nitrospinae bacterium]|nr:DHA2 family efflux MFS transporter permease subunit [Nitrospinota bacterium]
MNPTYLEGPRRGIATFSLTLATFMNVLDTTIANVSIPAIAGSLSVSPSQGTWVITSYSVSMAIVLPLTGWLARRFGEVRVFTACTALFSLASWLCGLSPDFYTLVLLRTLQGAVAGPMIPLSQSLLLRCYPPEKKGLALAFWSMTTVLAPILGPILGGYITDNIGWPWIFYINIPVGITSSYITLRVLGERESAVVKQPIDVVGLMLLIAGVGSLQLMLDWGHEMDWFESNQVTLLALASVVALSFFLVWEYYEEHPVVDFSLFKLRNFTVGTLSISLGYMTFFGGVVIFPLWLQTQMGYTATWAGLAAAPIGIVTLIMSPVIGSIVYKVDVRPLASFGFAVFAFTCFWQGMFNTSAGFFDVAAPRLAQGLGMVCFFIPLTTLSIAGLSPDRIASASGLTNFLRIIGGSFGTSISVTMWERRESYHQSYLVEKVNMLDPVGRAALEGAQSLGIGEGGAYAMLHRTVGNQAVMLATNDIFLLCGAVFSLLVFFVWLARSTEPVGRR